MASFKHNDVLLTTAFPKAVPGANHFCNDSDCVDEGGVDDVDVDEDEVDEVDEDGG